MKHYSTTEFEKGNAVTHVYSNITADELSRNINQLFTESGYVKQGTNDNPTTYTKGNRFMRIMFGAFCKYYKFTVIVQPTADGVKLTIASDSSGMSGGAIGMQQVKNEFNRLKQQSAMI